MMSGSYEDLYVFNFVLRRGCIFTVYVFSLSVCFVLVICCLVRNNKWMDIERSLGKPAARRKWRIYWSLTGPAGECTATLMNSSRQVSRYRCHGNRRTDLSLTRCETLW